jgi:hypothetical protein
MKDMNIQLVQDAVNLFVETIELDTMDTENPRFNKLYEKECQIYILFEQMTENELDKYRAAVKLISETINIVSIN